jgi:hypothetical protein
MVVKTNKQLRLCLVAKNPCIRVVKEAYALWHTGECKLYHLAPRLQDLQPFSFLGHFGSPKQLEDAVKLIGKSVDVFIVHNEPSWPAFVIRQALPNSKIILNIHDSLYWYMDDELAIGEKTRWYEEDYSMDASDGFIVPSNQCKQEIIKRTDKPVIDLPPACPMYDYRVQFSAFLGGLVSQGGHAVAGHYHRLNEYWRDYTKLYTYLNGRKEVFVYTPSIQSHGEEENVVYKHYKPLVTDVQKVPYEVLLNKVGQHSWNLVGNWEPHPVWKYSGPNKFYDALAAGTPSVVFQVESVKELIEEYGFGIVINHPDELLDRWDEHTEKRNNVMKYRNKVSMDQFIGRELDLCRKVLNG